MRKAPNRAQNYVPPEGGWGWVVCFAYVLSTSLTFPILFNLGLIFRQKFAKLGFTATDSALILHTNLTVIMISGLGSSALLKKYSYRKVALCGGFLASFGLVSLSFANNFTYFFIAHGIVTALGYGGIKISYPLALHSYFKIKRGLATGFAMTGVAFGSILFPQLVSYLLSVYTAEQTILLIGGLALHSVIAATLLQPIKWHAKKEIKEQVELALLMTDHQTDSKTLQDDSERKTAQTSKEGTSEIHNIGSNQTRTANKMEGQARSKSHIHTICSRIVQYYDLDMFKNPSYITLQLGVAIVSFTELNFSLMFPFILGTMGLSTYKTAQTMSLVSAVDIVFRLLFPFIAGYFKQPPKNMMLLTLLLLIISKTALILVVDSTAIMCVAVILGVARGFRIVVVALIVPSYVPIEKLPSALGIQMALNGILSIIGGPLLGIITDISGSHTNAITINILLSVLALTMWVTELVYAKCIPKQTNVL